MEKAQLHYSITLRHLWGTAGGHVLWFEALSGGRGGSTTPGAADPHVVNNVFLIGQKTDHAHDIHGGPLPIGEYEIETPEHHDHLGLSARLTPEAGGFTFGMFGRGGFYIHGRGPHGSDGCIVPTNPEDFHSLMDGLTESEGGTLTVWP